MATYINRECMNNMLDELCVNDSLYNALQTIPTIDIEPDKFDDTAINSQTIMAFAEKLKADIKKLEANSTNKIYQAYMQAMLDDIFPKIIDNSVNDFINTLGGEK